GFDVLDRLHLIGGLTERKRVFEFALPRTVLGEGVTWTVEALLVEDDEFLGNRLDLVTHGGFRLRPVASAEPGQLRALPTAVEADRIDLIARNVQLVVTTVRQQQIVPFRSPDRSFDHAVVAGHTVVVVHNVISDA